LPIDEAHSDHLFETCRWREIIDLFKASHCLGRECLQVIHSLRSN